MIKSEIIADSVNIVGNRLTTFILEYPRYIHSEIMTHRVFSKNAASSRAIPIEKMIQQIKENPAMPEHWGKNQSGMSANEQLDDIEKTEGSNNGPWFVTKKQKAKEIWLESRDSAIEYVKQLNEIGLHKQIANRILEPWFHIKIILSGTEFENFFALRAHKDAHPDFQKLAYMMLSQYNENKPKNLQEGEWHIPFGDKMGIDKIENLVLKINNCDHIELPGHLRATQELIRKIAIARCARISYFNYEGKDDYEADIKLCDRLFGNNPKHLSPTEHVAMAVNDGKWYGNFHGWKQYRKFFSDENLKDERVNKY